MGQVSCCHASPELSLGEGIGMIMGQSSALTPPNTSAYRRGLGGSPLLKAWDQPQIQKRWSGEMAMSERTAGCK